MNEVPESMKSDLAAWNDGRGIDLLSWTGCMGNFSLAVGYLEVFWPTFVSFEKYILTDGFNLESLRAFERDPMATRQSIEWAMNHLHLADIQHDACEDISPDKLMFLGKRMREIYSAKLAMQFPDRAFSVEFHVPEALEDFEDYVLGFSQS